MFCAVFVCGLLLPPDSQAQDHTNPSYPSSYSEWIDYQIDPKTILKAIELGETEIFTPIFATPDPNTPLLPSGSMPWAQSDYMKIANAISLYVWKQPLDLKSWNLYALAFDRECQDNSHGFDSMRIIYYQTIGTIWKRYYPTRYIQIYPLASQVSAGSSSTFDSHFYKGNNPISLTKFTITADDALQIAEKNGGKERRSKVGNDCRILITALNNDHNDSWNIYYYPGVYFKMLVDPYTGTYRILNDK